MEAASVCVGQMVSTPRGTGREGRGAGVHRQIPAPTPSSTSPFLWLLRVSVAGARCARLATRTWDWRGAELGTHCRLSVPRRLLSWRAV